MGSFFLGLVSTPGTANAESEAQPERPDILLIIADDMDNEHFEHLHPAVQAPNLARMRRRGTTFPTAWMHPRCAPSLASILTGIRPEDHGRYFNRDETPAQRNADIARSFPRLLKQAGYRSYKGGKWWFGDFRDAGFEAGEPTPNQFVRHGQQSLFDWLGTLEESERFFLWWAPQIPHVPHNPPEEHLQAIDVDAIPIPDHILPSQVEDYLASEVLSLAMVRWLDTALGELGDELNRLNRADNLLVIFCIDNGFSNSLISKGSPYEKSWNSPITLVFRGQIPRNETRPHLVSVVDLYPTILDYAKLPLPGNLPGRSLRIPIETPDAPWRRHLIEAAWPASSFQPGWRGEVYSLAIRSQTWKLISWLSDLDGANNTRYRITHRLQPFPTRRRGQLELYNLKQDPYELNDLSENPRFRAYRDHLEGLLRSWWAARHP